MCFEWDERYRREQAIRLSKEKADELLKRTQEAARADSALGVATNVGSQSVVEREEAIT